MMKLPKIWLMRQAGRYLPEYLKVRDTTTGILDLCFSSAKAAEVTIQPIERFGMDAAIIFSDILVLPYTLGWDVRFEKGEGPIMSCFKSFDDFAKFNFSRMPLLEEVYRAIGLVKEQLPSIPLIGFVGAPWTVAIYLLEGKRSKDSLVSKNLIYTNRKLVSQLIDFLIEPTITHLLKQIKAGAEIVQIFDSWAGVLSDAEFFDFIIEPTRRIILAVKQQYPEIPIIGFPRACGYLYDSYIDQTGIDIIAVDQFVPIEQIKKWQDRIIVQGNLDPLVLTANPEIIKDKCNQILTNLDRSRLIFNIGHGIVPSTNPENVKFLVEYVKNY